MKKILMVLLMVSMQMLPVAASEEEDGYFVPKTEEEGGTIYGTVTGRAPGDVDEPVDPDNPGGDNPNISQDSNGEAGQNGNGRTSDTTGTDTGDKSYLIYWLILLAIAYIIIRKSRTKEMQTETVSNGEMAKEEIKVEEKKNKTRPE